MYSKVGISHVVLVLNTLVTRKFKFRRERASLFMFVFDARERRSLHFVFDARERRSLYFCIRREGASQFILPDSLCSLCKSPSATVSHVLSGCKVALDQGRYTLQT